MILNKHKDMNRITNLFNTKKDGILSVYFTAGYPALDDTTKILKELQAKGIDMVEVGIPFSDPMADGPVIQEAATQALRNGMSLRLLFDQLKDIRRDVHIPIILMGYLNPIMQFGFEAFCRKCVETGVDGMIIPDLPFADYMADYKAIAERYELKMITHPSDRRTYRWFHLYGIECCNHRSTTELQRTEAGLFPPYQRNGLAKPAPRRFRYFEQSYLRCSRSKLIRCHYRQQIHPIIKE